MNGLIIKKEWLDLIIEGKKTLEIRGSDTKHKNEKIYLLESGSHKVRGTCIIEDTYPISSADWYVYSSEKNQHCIDTSKVSYEDLLKRYKNPYAWVLKDIIPINYDCNYEYKKGSIIWVKDVKLLYHCKAEDSFITLNALEKYWEYRRRL